MHDYNLRLVSESRAIARAKAREAALRDSKKAEDAEREKELQNARSAVLEAEALVILKAREEAKAAEDARINAAATDDWFYIQDEEQIGPVGLSKLIDILWNPLTEPPLKLVWTQGMDDWKPFYDVQKLSDSKPTGLAQIDHNNGNPHQLEATVAELRAEAEAELRAAAEAEASEERAKALEEKSKAENEARLRADVEAKALKNARDASEAKANALKEAELRASAEAKAEEEIKLRVAAEVRAEEQAKLRATAEAKAVELEKLAAAAKAKAEKEARAAIEEKEKAEEAARTKVSEEANLRAVAEAKAAEESRLRAAAETKAKELSELAALAEAKAKQEACAAIEEKAKAEAAAKAKASEEANLRTTAEAKAAEESKLKTAAEAKAVAEEKAAGEARIAAEDRKRSKAANKARIKAAKRAKFQAAAKARADAEMANAATQPQQAAADAGPKTAARNASDTARTTQLSSETAEANPVAMEPAGKPKLGRILSRNVWFYTCEGERKGPVSFEELRTMGARSQLDPRLDLVWKLGTDLWKSAGEIDGLFERKDIPAKSRKAFESRKIFSNSNRKKSRNLAIGDRVWPGARRRSLLLVTLAFPFAWQYALSAASPYLVRKFGETLMGNILPAATLLPLLVFVHFGLKRLINLGMSRWWLLALSVPILNIWVGFRCFACPDGYAYHRKLDQIGVASAILYGLILLAGMLYPASTIVPLFNALASPTTWKSLF